MKKPKVEVEDDGFGGFEDEDGTPPAAKPEVAEVEEAKLKPEPTPKERLIAKMLHKAGVETIPDIKFMLAGKVGETVKVKDIGIFIGKPDDEILAALAKECPVRNRVNLSAEVTVEQVTKVGIQLLSVGRMVQPITLARIKEDGALECTSGRHRLVAIALLYGSETDVVVYIEDSTMSEARDTVVFANDCRSAKAMEKAEHVVLKAVNGNVDVKQDELYASVCTSIGKARKYAVYSVFERKHPARLAFPVSFTASRKDGCLTTVNNIENFWKAAIEWNKTMERKTFDAALKGSVEFLNALVAAMQTIEGFDSEQHLASMVLSALGKFYYEYEISHDANAITVVDKVARDIVSLGNIGRQPSKDTYKAISRMMLAK